MLRELLLFSDSISLRAWSRPTLFKWVDKIWYFEYFLNLWIMFLILSICRERPSYDWMMGRIFFSSELFFWLAAQTWAIAVAMGSTISGLYSMSLGVYSTSTLVGYFRNWLIFSYYFLGMRQKLRGRRLFKLILWSSERMKLFAEMLSMWLGLESRSETWFWLRLYISLSDYSDS